MTPGDTPHEAQAADRIWRVLVPAAVVLLTFLVFMPALGHELLQWDDADMLLENSNYRGLGWPQLCWMFTTFHAANYQPLSWMTYALDYSLWGVRPFGFHLTNILLHCANASLFYFLCLRFFAARRPVFSDVLGAGFAALLFSLHPLRVESVAWVSERRDVLSGLFFLATLLCWLRRFRASEAHRPVWYLLAWLAYILALLSKTIVVTLPAVLVILDFYPLGRLPASPRECFDARHRGLWLEKIPFLIPALIISGIALRAQVNYGAVVSLERSGFIDRAAQSLYGLSFYMWKSLLPFQLSPVYEWYWQSEPARFLLGSALTVTLTAWILRLRSPALGAAYAYYVVTLIPVLGIIKYGTQTVADRYSYLPCLSLALLAGAGLRNLIRAPGPLSRTARPAFLAAAAAALLSWQTSRQIPVWRDSETLWRHVLRLIPSSSMARVNLGAAAYEKGRFNEAVLWWQEHARTHPQDEDARNKLAQIMSRTWKTPPDLARIHNDAGVELSEQGDWNRAVWHFRRALRLDPGLTSTYNNLGLALYRQGRAAEAAESYKSALRLDPASHEAHTNLGIALARLGRFDEAADRFREALRLRPGYQPAKASLLQMRRLEKDLLK